MKITLDALRRSNFRKITLGEVWDNPCDEVRVLRTSEDPIDQENDDVNLIEVVDYARDLSTIYLKDGRSEPSDRSTVVYVR